MAQLDADQFFKSIKNGEATAEELKPVYLLFGEETYLVQQALRQLKQIGLRDGAADFNFDSFYAADCDPNQVRDVVETLPMMSAKRVVILNEAQELTDKEWQMLEPVLSSPVEGTVFVIVASSIDKRKKYFKLILDKSTVVEFKRPYENKVPAWIRYISHTYGLEISNEALQLLHKLTGSHLSEIEGEIKKLQIYLGDKNRIEVDDVAASVSRTKEESVFDLTEAIGSSNRVKALSHLVHLLQQGQNEIGIISLVARHVRILLQIKNGIEQGMGGSQLAQFAQVPPYYVQKYIEQSRLWTQKRLEDVILLLARTDKDIKSSPIEKHILLENLVFSATR